MILHLHLSLQGEAPVCELADLPGEDSLGVRKLRLGERDIHFRDLLGLPETPGDRKSLGEAR